MLDTVAGKKSIFRERLEEAQFLAELSRKSREEQAEEVRFLRDDPGKHVADALLKQQQNEFEQSHFDPLFPVHNLCGPWNSGSQASNLEWCAVFLDFAFHTSFWQGRASGQAVEAAQHWQAEVQSVYGARSNDWSAR